MIKALKENIGCSRLTEQFGNSQASQHLLKSFETGADVLPALQRLLWLGNSNHTVVCAGAKLSEIETAPGIPVPDRIIYNHDGGKTPYLNIKWIWPGKPEMRIPALNLKHSPAQARRMKRSILLH